MKKLIFLIIFFLTIFHFTKTEERQITINGENFILELNPMNQESPVFDIGKEGLIKLLQKNDKKYIGHLWFHKIAENANEIVEIYIEKQFRNKGFGQFLIKYFCDELLKKYKGRNIIVRPTPFENNECLIFDKEKYKSLNTKLIKFYNTLEFCHCDAECFEKKLIYNPSDKVNIIRSAIYINSKTDEEDKNKKIFEITNLILQY